MELRSLVRINDEGLVADAVNFDMMDDAEKNLSLCKGFVFNYDPRKPKESTVGVLDCVRRSFFSRAEPNVHLVVQDYGKGKSHFALAMANFFQKPAESQEVQGILHQVELATHGKDAIAEDLRTYKNRSKTHLVIRISGDKEIDLRQMFLRAVRRTLDAEGLVDTLAHHLCDRPLKYLEGLSPDHKKKADGFLRESNAIYGDIDTDAVIKLLRGQDYRSVLTVVDISRQLTQGFAIDFEADVRIEAILDDLVARLCSGEDRKYQGVLIVFDELYAYLHDSWVPNPARAGGMALQNITNACENHKSQLALVCLTQVRPLAVQPAELSTAKTYQKLATRLELAPSTYEPMSSLELVLDALINTQSEEQWAAFRKEWAPTFRSDSEKAYEHYITLYKERNWPYHDFVQHLALGCFPLHPLTSYFLCNLDFTQGRTAVQFIKEDVKQFIRTQPAEKGGFPNYLFAVQLVDAFASNLSNHPSYSDYARAMAAVTASADENDQKVLKALFLFYVSGSKLKKPDQEPHEELLAFLTGLSVEDVKQCLKRLTADLGVIYRIPKNNTYRFYAGLGLSDLKKAIENEIAGVAPSIDEVVKYCQSNLDVLLGGGFVEGARFVADNRLNAEDWVFEVRLHSVGTLRQLLLSGVLGTRCRGIVAYVMPASVEEAVALRSEVNDLIVASPAKERIVIAIPTLGVGEVARTLLLLKTLKGKGAAEREKYGEAYAQLQKLWEEEVVRRLAETFRSCDFYHPVIQTLPVAYREDSQHIVSKLLDQLYPFTPSLESVDKLRSGHSTGAKIVTFAVRQLFGNTLSKQNLPDKSYVSVIDGVLVRRWGLLAISVNSYSVQQPTDRRVQTAWNRISEACDLGDQKETRVPFGQLWRTLAADPYGYNELTFVALLGGWLTRHRQEVRIGVSRKKPDGKPIMYEATLSRFVEPGSAYDKEFGKPKDFLAFFTADATTFLIRREPITDVTVPDAITYDEAPDLIAKINDYLAQDGQDKAKATDLVRKKQEIEEGIQIMDNWSGPIQTVLQQQLPVSIAEIVSSCAKIVGAPDEFTTGVVVKPSQSQVDQQLSAIARLKGAIETVLNSHASRAATFSSDSEFTSLAAQVDRDLEACRRIPMFWSAFELRFEEITLAAQRRVEHLLREQKLRENVAAVERLSAGLNANSSEQSLARAERELRDAAGAVPALSSTQAFKAASGKVESHLKALADGLAKWRESSERLSTSRDAERLRDEVVARQERYDSDASKSLVKDVLEALSLKAEELKRLEELERVFRQRITLASTLSTQIRTLSDVLSSLKLYDELTQTLATDPGSSPASVLSELNKIEAAAHCEIVGKVKKLCSEQSSSIADLDRRVELLTRVKAAFLGRVAFAEVAGNIDAGLVALSAARTKLVESEGDRQVIGRIRQVKPDSVNSLARCREQIAEVSELEARLHNPTAYAPEVRQLISNLQSKARTYAERLAQIRNALTTVSALDKLTELQRYYNQLDLVFRGSDMEAEYVALDSSFAGLRGDLEVRADLISRAKGANSVLACRAVMELATSKTADLYDAGRFGAEIRGLSERVGVQLAGYARKLQECKDGIATSQTRKDAENLWERVVAQSAVFVGSELEGDYSELRSELESLVSFMRVRKPVKDLHTQHECEGVLEAVGRWRVETADIASPALLERVNAYEEDVRAVVLELESARRAAANAWLRRIAETGGGMRSKPANSDAGLVAQIMNSIAGEAARHRPFLDSPGLKELEEIELYCKDVVDSDRETQILALLGQLPIEKQATICRRLAATLHLQVVSTEMSESRD